MNKLFTKIAALCLGATMAVGVGVAVASNSEAEAVKAAEGDVLAQVSGTGSGYGRQTTTDSHSVGWVTIGQSGYLGINSAKNNTGAKAGVNVNDLPVAKAVDASATSSTSTSSNSCTGYYTFYTTTTITNAGSLVFYYSANDGNSTAKGYVVYSSTPSSSGGTAWSQVELKSSSTSKQGDSLGTSGTFTYTFNETQTSAKYYGFVIQTTSYKRMTGGQITIKEGASQSKTNVVLSLDSASNSMNVGATQDLTVTATAQGGGAVTDTLTYSYSSSSTSVATVSNTGRITAVAIGSTTITVTSAATSNYNAGSTTLNLTVSDPNSDAITFDATNAATPTTPISINSTRGTTVVFNRNTGTTTPVYNATGPGVRAYGGNNFIVSSTGRHLKTIVLSFGTGDNSNTITTNVNTYSSGTWDAGSAKTIDSVTFTVGGTSGHRRVKSISITYWPESSSPLDHIVISGSYPTTFGVGAEFSHEGMTVTAYYEDESHEAVTDSAEFSGYNMASAEVQTVTVSYTENNVTKTATYDITVKDVVISTNTIKENGTAVPATVTKDGYYNDDTFTFTATVVYVSGAAYEPGSGEVTWNSSSTSVATITSNGVVSPVANGSTTISATPKDGSNAAQKIASFTLTISNLKERIYVEVSDEITLSDTGITGTGYNSWSGVTKKSTATYAGNNAGGNNALQYNNANSSGLYSSASGGKLYSVSVVWNSNTSGSGTRKLYIYGTNTLPTAIGDASSATKLGEVNAISGTTNVIDDDFEYEYLIITGCGSAVYVDKITVTWKTPGAEYPLESDPVLSVNKDEIYVGKTTTLTVVTDPVNSDEVLNVTSSDETIATVSGSNKTYTIYGVSEGTVTITVSGSQIPEGESEPYSSTIDIDVVTAVQLVTDKVLTYEELGLDAGSYASNDGDHFYEAVEYTTFNVIRNGSSFQFRNGNPSPGYLYNKDAYSWNIKSITLIGASTNANDFMVYEGTAAEPSTEVAVSGGTFNQNGVNTYVFSSGMTYFKIGTTSGTGNHHLDYIVVELVDSASSDLTKARQAATEILDALDGLCGTGGSGYVSASDWSDLNSTLSDLLSSASGAKTILHDAVRLPINNLSQGSASIENAMFHYDYCVTKFGYSPYSGITPVQANTRVSPLNIVTSDGNVVAIIVIISMISVTAIGGYFFLRKRKEN